jgi:pimeloyl-ACP methyl ester carboxylesterase
LILRGLARGGGASFAVLALLRRASPLGVPANGLTHRVLEWDAGEPLATAWLLHGHMDAAASWDRVAEPLASAGLRVLAPDFRGFGEGPRVSAGGYYHFSDYVFDLADLVDALTPPQASVVLVGHSMGGVIATLYAGTFPERRGRLALLEGMGPTGQSPDDYPERMRAWVDGVRAVRARDERTIGSREEALRRLVVHHPDVPPEVLATRVDVLARPRPGGRLAWRADPLHSTRAPVPFLPDAYRAFARRVTWPVLFVSGGPLGWHPSDEEERLAAFADLRRAELPDAGHMMHWTRAGELARELTRFALEGPALP